MNSATGFRDLEAIRAPLVRTNRAEQRAQRGDRRIFRRTKRLHAGLPDIGSATQRNRVVVIERDQQGVEGARTLRPGLAVEMKRLRVRSPTWHSRLALRFTLGTIRAPAQCVQHLARLLE